MKKVLLLLLPGLLVFVLSPLGNAPEAHSSTSGSPSGKTGSPGDGNSCTQCHGGVANTVSNWITTNVPVTGYMPGFTYQVTATATHSGSGKFGFQVSPQNGSGQQRGTLTATNTAETQTQLSGKYITHKSAGTAGSGSRSWTFNWTAPAPGSGAVTLYGAFNASNSGNNSSGDVIYLSSVTFQEDVTSVAEHARRLQFSFYPNPAAEQLFLHTETSDPFLLEIISLEGKTVKQLDVKNLHADAVRVDVSELAAGVYLLRLSNETQAGIQKFIKQ